MLTVAASSICSICSFSAYIDVNLVAILKIKLLYKIAHTGKPNNTSAHVQLSTADVNDIQVQHQ
jgi:hypothetical protein